MTESRRFLIETLLPLRELSAEARREKAIRHGHISTLHVWWARRPLVVARAAVLGALLSEEAEVNERFIANLCQWGVHDGDPGGRLLLEQARNLIRRRFGGEPPKVLDSFAGGGSIPLEALRLGAEAYAVEYNPVAYLILKATLEYPQRYGQKLASEVKRWGEWVLERARRELKAFYPAVGGETPIAYIWSRTIRCPNPSCGAEIPLFRQFWLARKANKQVALKPLPNPAAKRVEFAIVHGNGIDFDPSKGTVSRGNAVCLVCHTSAKGNYVKAEAQAGRMGHRLVAVVTTRGKGQGRNYRLATEEDMEAFRKAEKALQNLLQTPSPWAFGLSWVPEEPSPGTIGRYGMTTWGKFFNPRQLLALVTFGKGVRAAHGEILRQTQDPDFARAVTTYLALIMDALPNRNCLLSAWGAPVEKMLNVFSGHYLRMTWDYAEINPLAEGTGTWQNFHDLSVKVVGHCAQLKRHGQPHLGSAANLPFPDRHFDAVVIDPPYADNVPYADLSDFFYIWLRRTVGDLYPEAFRWTLTPKDEEAVVNPARFGGRKQGEQIAQKHYERLMQQSFAEIYRVLKPGGMAVVMFTHRSTAAWESLIGSLLDAGLYPTVSFPVHTEFEGSTHQSGKGAIQSTILMACRRRPENAPVGWYAQVRTELERVIPERLAEFLKAGGHWEERFRSERTRDAVKFGRAEIRGADLFISAIGPAVGVFGKYRKVMRPDGQEVTVTDLLDEARGIATAFALKLVGLDWLDEPTRFYVLYRWAYGWDELSFDEANKLAKSVGAELDALEALHHLVERKGDTVQVPGYDKRLKNEAYLKALQKALEDGKIAKLPEIDRVHHALYLWSRAETEELADFLMKAGVRSEDDGFWQTAQALLEVEKDEGGNPVGEEAKCLAQFLGAKGSILRRVDRQLRLQGL